VSAANDQGQQTDYYYDRGTWYQKQGDVYIAIAAPIGSVITDLPDGCETVTVSGKDYYYYAGDFYAHDSKGYKVVKAPRGAAVSSLPDGYKEQTDGDVTYDVYNNVKYEAKSSGDDFVYVVS